MPICASNQNGNLEPRLPHQDSQSFRGNVHVGVLPSVNNEIKLELAENEKWPTNSEFEIYHCALQLEVKQIDV